MPASQIEYDLLMHINDGVCADKVHTEEDGNKLRYRNGYMGNRILSIFIEYSIKPSHPKYMCIDVTNLGIGQYGELLEARFEDSPLPNITKHLLKIDSGRTLEVPIMPLVNDTSEQTDDIDKPYSIRFFLEELAAMFDRVKVQKT